MSSPVAAGAHRGGRGRSDPRRPGLSTAPPGAHLLDRRAPRVVDVSIRHPKICSANVTVAEIRRLFLDDHVQIALIVDGRRLISAVERADVQVAVSGDALACTVGELGDRTIDAGASLGEAMAQMTRGSRRRVAVVDDRGLLVGLVCLKRHGNGFCSIEDIERRRGCRKDSVQRAAFETNEVLGTPA